jgi:hypothetical protein
VTAGTVIIEEQADIWLKESLLEFESDVNEYVTVALTQNQFDALVLFSYNTDADEDDSVWREINAGNFEQAMIELAGWRNSNDERLDGLIARRNDEIELFVSGDTTRDYNYTDHYENQDDITQFISKSVIDGITNGDISSEDANNALSTFKLAPDGGTNFDSESYGFDINTNFLYGNSEQGIEEFEFNLASILNDGLLWSGGPATVTSMTANDSGFWAEVNAAISDGYQPGRNNLIDSTTSDSVSDLWWGFSLENSDPDDTQWSHDNISEYASWVQGTNTDDVLSGTSEIDRIDGGEGDDVLSGLGGDDAFVFADNFGEDIVSDFMDGDVIEFTGNTFDSYAAVLANMVEGGQDIIITLDAGNSLTLNNTTISDLQADDFRFV